MVSRALLRSIGAAGLSLASFGQTAVRVAAIPADPLEMATGPIQVVNAPADREAVLQLLARARKSYDLRAAGQGYDLKVVFTVNSGAQTDYDGAWQMEDVSDPAHGLRWTATGVAGYTTTQISANKMLYGVGTATTIPLRLHEARAALFGPMGSAANAQRASIRTATASFHGAQVTCVLLTDPGFAPSSAPGRHWEETEECIDPQTGLLQVHSQAPGRYYAYQYSNALQLGGHLLPQKVMVTEAGRVVSEISVVSLTPLSDSDASLFVPSAEMKAQGASIAMSGAQKMSRLAAPGPVAPGATVRPVCVFGLVTQSGDLVEAHSLQPSDPNSQAAVEAVKRMNFSRPLAPGERPQQHFVFVIEKFVSTQQRSE